MQPTKRAQNRIAQRLREVTSESEIDVDHSTEYLEEGKSPWLEGESVLIRVPPVPQHSIFSYRAGYVALQLSEKGSKLFKATRNSA